YRPHRIRSRRPSRLPVHPGPARLLHQCAPHPPGHLGPRRARGPEAGRRDRGILRLPRRHARGEAAPQAPAGARVTARPRIWVDADACPGVICDILFRAAERARIEVTFVANQWFRTPPSRYLKSLQVQGGFDVADDAIVERVRAGDLVVTQDIPLAARV